MNPTDGGGPQAAPAPTMVTVIPDDLKKLARFVARGFYSREDVLIIDLLVRHHCIREDDISSLLKFDKKLVRAKIAGLKKDRLVHEKSRMETKADDPTKVEKMNCYFINYKVFVNVVKYKLDLMRRKMETTERDATSRSSFKCSSCSKAFTDLEGKTQSNKPKCQFMKFYLIFSRSTSGSIHRRHEVYVLRVPSRRGRVCRPPE